MSLILLTIILIPILEIYLFIKIGAQIGAFNTISLIFITAKEAGNPRPRVTNYIGSCFLKIATHLSYKPNFVNYMFREDMICDGIENCLQYIDNFDPEKSKNPFAYFTQIIYYAFLRRIQKEKKQLEIKGKILERSGYDEVMHTDTYDGSMSGMNASYSDMGSIKENIETKMNR